MSQTVMTLGLFNTGGSATPTLSVLNNNGGSGIYELEIRFYKTDSNGRIPGIYKLTK